MSVRPIRGVTRFLVTRISTGEHFRCAGKSIRHAEEQAAAHWKVSTAQVMGYDTRDLEDAPPSEPPPLIASPDRLIQALAEMLSPDEEGKLPGSGETPYAQRARPLVHERAGHEVMPQTPSRTTATDSHRSQFHPWYPISRP